ncbi:hypothetical protein [Microbacterium gilvum]|uniref:Ferredoxin-NADPH reductase n=1 Tax=Microbacterium gilvum TaxID=1336204 RepID=A0ABP9A705_9MICO
MSAPATRTGRLLAHDGRIAGWLLAIWQCFLAGASFLAALAPLILFQALVGWQPTHLAIALFGVAVLPVVPGLHALLVATGRVLDHGGAARAGAVFWLAFREGCGRLRGVALSTGAVVVVLSYDLALFPEDDAVTLVVLGFAITLIAVLLAICATAAAAPARGPALIAAASAAAARRPHIVLAWLLLVALGTASCAVPVLGPSLMVFAPALVALGIHICNRALGFGPRIEQENL